MRLATAVACLALLSACSKPVPPAPAQVAVAATPAPVMAEAKPAPKPTVDGKAEALLMKAVFGEQYREATRDALAELPDPDKRTEKMRFVVSPVAHTILATGETVLVANAETASDDGTALSSHAAGGLLNVFLMRQADGKWEILKRHENVTALGSHGNLGTVQWVNLAKGKPGLAILSGGTWQGYTIEVLSLFDLGADTMRDLAGQIQVHSNSEGGCDPDGDGQCWSVTGKWRFESARAASDYDDIVVDFSGELTSRPKAAKGKAQAPRVAEKVGGAARYAFDGKLYRLVDGVNPVPGI
jgi:hypothetical protein